MKEFCIIVERFNYTAKTSLGRIYFNYDGKKEFFCYSLEDAARAWGIKVYGETCLPGGLKCYVSLFENPHYGKTIIFHTEDDDVTIRFGPLSWVGCLAHGGNSAIDTEGCVIIAKYIVDEDHVYVSMKDQLRQAVEQKIAEGYTIKAEFSNLIQNQTSREFELPPIKINIISLLRLYFKLRKWFKHKKRKSYVF